MGRKLLPRCTRSIFQIAVRESREKISLVFVGRLRIAPERGRTEAFPSTALAADHDIKQRGLATPATWSGPMVAGSDDSGQEQAIDGFVEKSIQRVVGTGHVKTLH